MCVFCAIICLCVCMYVCVCVCVCVCSLCHYVFVCVCVWLCFHCPAVIPDRQTDTAKAQCVFQWCSAVPVCVCMCVCLCMCEYRVEVNGFIKTVVEIIGVSPFVFFSCDQNASRQHIEASGNTDDRERERKRERE